MGFDSVFAQEKFRILDSFPNKRVMESLRTLLIPCKNPQNTKTALHMHTTFMEFGPQKTILVVVFGCLL